MKNKTLLSVVLIFLISSFIVVSCEDDKDNNNVQTTADFPDKFRVDIPSSISNTQEMKSAEGDTISGNEMYEHLTNFIAIGDAAAELVEEIMLAIGEYNLSQEISFTYTGDDGREKFLQVIADVTFEGKTWAFQLTVTDTQSEDEADGGIGMQVFWNANPIDGIAILKPYNIDRINDSELGEAMYRIDYNELGANGYDAEMTVYISDLPMLSPLVDPYGVDNLKMFAGKNGDYVDVYGNSNHPNAKFYNDDVGFDWAFVASCDESIDVATAEVGLPPNTLNASDRQTLLVTHSIYNVFEVQILDIYPGLDQAIIDAYLFNTQAPAYFDANGFVVGGTAPDNTFNQVADRIITLTPFNPSQINSLTISFKQ
jgi:hypothetical protein